MTYAARITIATLTALAAITSFVLALKFAPGLGSTMMFGLGSFCVVVAMACLWEESRPLTLRLIGASVFALSIYLLVGTSALERQLASIALLLWFGIPAGYLMIFGRYPTWGRWSKAFRPDGQEEHKKVDEVIDRFEPLP